MTTLRVTAPPRAFAGRNPSLIETALEELLRHSPVQTTSRIAMEDLEIGGKGISKGQLIQTYLAAASDPAQFPDPDRLDITSQPLE